MLGIQRRLQLEELEGRNLPAPLAASVAGLAGSLLVPAAAPNSSPVLVTTSAANSKGLAAEAIVATSLAPAATAIATPGTSLAIGAIQVPPLMQATFTPPFVPAFILSTTAFAYTFPGPIGAPNPVRTATAPPETPGSQWSLPPLYQYVNQDIKLSGAGVPAYYGDPPYVSNYSPEDEVQIQIDASTNEPTERGDIVAALLMGDEFFLTGQ
jgi:hypothetical protein